jgi:NifU-like protein involved in Fe-S cluster formation
LAKVYSEQFKDHLTNPRNVGELSDANARAEETNPVCGDRLVFYLRLRDEVIEAAQFLAYGCPPTLVCGSALTEMLIGKSLVDAHEISRKELVAAVGGLPARKQHAAALAIETLKAALKALSAAGATRT